MSQAVPPQGGPTEKERKYDRQLRLWAASGQAALESSNILLVNSGPGTVGVETLKNLVLPGIGQFTIADDAVVEAADLGVNFFLDESSRGKPRAQCTTEYLMELNPEVSGEWYPKSPGKLDIQAVLSNASPYTIILYTLPLPAETIQVIEDYGRHHNIPLVAIRSVGFYGYFRVTLPGVFPVVDTHPDETATADLRLLTPWPELSQFAQELTKAMDDLDDHLHGHLPLVAILLHYLDIWKQNYDGSLPTAYADKIAFRNLVSEGMRKDNAEGGEENFEEAVGAVMKHVTAQSLPGSLREVFEYDNAKKTRSSFWIVAEAVSQFYQKHGQLPVTGGLPDMKAQSSVYIQLQNIYKKKARQDADEVLTIVQSLAGDLAVDRTEVEQFCKNARFIKLINSAQVAPKMEDIVANELSQDEIAAIAGPEMQSSLISLYLALSLTPNSFAPSAEEMQKAIFTHAPALQGHDRTKQITEEVARAAGGEIHNISAVLGAKDMDLPLTCNNLKCRAELSDRALVTTCSHIFCLECTNRFCLPGQDRQNRVPCPACDTQLASPDDAVISNLKPSEAYKTSILSGLSPSIIMECAGRALSFWAYQTTQNIYYQQYLYKTLTEKYATLSGRLEQTVGEANAQIETLQRKIGALTTDNDSARKKNEELSRAYKEKNRQLLQTQELHDKLRHTVEMGHIQRAATDAIDSRFQQQQPQQPSRHFVAHNTASFNNNAKPRPGSVGGFRGYGTAGDPERISEGGIRGGLIDTGGGGGPWRRDGSATGHVSNAPATFSRFGARGLLDGERGLGMGHAPNSAERRRHVEMGGPGKHMGGLSSGIKVSQPMSNSGLQETTGGGFMGLRNI
ncbi:ubiquitin-like activating enzyme (UlaA) [Cordyceps fumosorosea ARSEF 2679]|uniref:Ubiquitin-like activating enzyme (UlaA) n=1 Tax=Cordyceps fumosorosea (strain ARSEF 2679) TaxID=1081104 RepID=A0A167NVS4_CORFA|nr:ubiquitin-like activating enzyme (UlaA) [Cordyceps fumosorosea ARSEF 2679]OAA55997.1 ubiquitin-like activating enzyme (UlaA) [Cordyceps fumosorosea ARSEF 2679]